MKNKILKLLAGVLVVALASCTVTMPVTVSNAPIGSKKGVSETVVVLKFIYLNNEYGIKEAAKKGKITGAIATVDEKTTNMILFSKKELIVTAAE